MAFHNPLQTPLISYSTGISYFTLNQVSMSCAIREAIKDMPHCLCEMRSAKKPLLTKAEKQQFENLPYDLMLSLFTGTCYRISVAENLAIALAQHYMLDEKLQSNIHLCLHEAIINSVIHGNLSVPGIFKSKAVLSNYYEWIETRLASPALNFSRIRILSTLKNEKLTLQVIDGGRGYAYGDYIGAEASLEAHQGLSLIRASCDSMDVLGVGNHIVMEFCIG